MYSNRLVVLSAAAAAVVFGLVMTAPLDGALPEVAPVDLQLDGPGQNIDDPCFWVNPVDPGKSLLFSTAKDSGLVEVWNASNGQFVSAIPGFGKPNNCAVSGNLLLTTDATRGDIKVHHLPDLTLVRTIGDGMGKPQGIDVSHPASGPPLVYVTDAGDASVRVYDLDSGVMVRSFPTGFGLAIEPIVVDDRYQRVFVAREEHNNAHGFGVFTPEGQLIAEYHADVFTYDTEGLALYVCGDGGYLIAADQDPQRTQFEVFDRVTLEHIGTFNLKDTSAHYTNATDGLDILQTPIPGFPNGVLAACDGCGSSMPEEMDAISWDKIADVMGLDICPNGLPPDCQTTPCVRRITPVADATLSSADPTVNFGSDPLLVADRSPTTHALLRFDVPDLRGLDVLEAKLRLTALDGPVSGSDHGGDLYATTSNWSESTVTYSTRPLAKGARIGVAGAVTSGQHVDFDVRSALKPGGGLHDFLLTSTSLNRAEYRSREAGQSPPALLLKVRQSNAPVITITRPAEGDRLPRGVPTSLDATAQDPEDGDVSAQIAWHSDRDGNLGTGPHVTPTFTTPGAHTITADVTDSSGLHSIATVGVVVNAPPAVTITAPADKTSVGGGTLLTFTATASSAQGGDLGANLLWTSDRSGTLGMGASISLALAAGVHHVTAAVHDATGSLGSAQITVTVVPSSPVVLIVGPAAGTVVTTTQAVALQASATDFVDGDISASIKWTSDRQKGTLATGGNVSVTGLVAGTHVLTATATDSSKLKGQAQVSITVVPGAVSAVAVGDAYVDAAAPTTNFGAAKVLQLGGTPEAVSYMRFLVTGTAGLDIESVTLQLQVSTASGAPSDGGGAVYKIADTGWDERSITYATRPPIDGAPLASHGPVAKGEVVTFDVTSAVTGNGPIVLAMTSASADAAKYNSREASSGRPTLLVKLRARGGPDLPPNVAITAPADGIVVLPGTPVTLTAAATDGVDGDLSGSVQWTSDLSGPLGTGSPLALSGLSVGTHHVRATATDSFGQSSTADMMLYVDAAPTVEILAPASGTTLVVGERLGLGGRASDTEDGDRSAAIHWSSSLDGPLGTGAALSVATLSPGTHAITASVSDHRGRTALATVSVSVSSATLTVPVVADAAIYDFGPDTNYGTALFLYGDTDTPKAQSFMRFQVTGTSGLKVKHAVLRMTVYWYPTSGSVAGGLIRSVSNNTWNEKTITFNHHPVVDGPVLASAGVVQPGQAVDFDVTAAVHGDGPVSFSLVPTVSDAVLYASREEPSGGAPQLILTLGTSATSLPPTVQIVTPTADTLTAFGSPLTLTATATDPESGDLSSRVQWSSDRDGLLGTGGTIVTHTLSTGAHLITARATDDSGAAAATTVSIYVRPGSLVVPPVADATVGADTPAKNSGRTAYLTVESSPEHSSYLRFVVNGWGPQPPDHAVLRLTVGSRVSDGGPIGGTLRAIPDDGWTELGITYANRPAVGGPSLVEIGAVTPGQVLDLDVGGVVRGDGTYVLALTSTSTNAVAYASREGAAGPVLVLTSDAPAMGPPVVAISAPSNGTSVGFGLPLVLTGTAADPEDGDLSSAIAWSSDRDGALGKGGSLTVSSLALGTHVITARATDTSGAVATATVTVTVTGGTLTFAAAADATVKADAPGIKFGTSATLQADSAPARRAYIRFVVRGVGNATVMHASLRLTVSTEASSGSAAGGDLHRITTTAWQESGITFTNSPPVDGPVLLAIGPVAEGQVVDLDVTSAVAGDGTYDFAIDTHVADRVAYVARDAGAAGPQLVLSVR